MSGLERIGAELWQHAESRARMYEEMERPVALQDRITNFALNLTVFGDVYYSDGRGDFRKMADGYREVLSSLNRNQTVEAARRYLELETSHKIPQLREEYESAREFQIFLGLVILGASAGAGGLALGALGFSGGATFSLGGLTTSQTWTALSILSTTTVLTHRILEEGITGEDKLYDRSAPFTENAISFGEEVALTSGMFLLFGTSSLLAGSYLRTVLSRTNYPLYSTIGVPAGIFVADLAAFTAFDMIHGNYQGIKSGNWDPGFITGQCLTPEAWRNRVLTMLVIKEGLNAGLAAGVSFRPQTARGSETPKFYGPEVWRPAFAAEGVFPNGGFVETIAPLPTRPIQMAGSSPKGSGAKSPPANPNTREPDTVTDTEKTAPVAYKTPPEKRKTEPMLRPIITEQIEAVPPPQRLEERDIVTETDLIYSEGAPLRPAITDFGSGFVEPPTSLNQRLVHTVRVVREKKAPPEDPAEPLPDTRPTLSDAKTPTMAVGTGIVSRNINPREPQEILVVPVLTEKPSTEHGAPHSSSEIPRPSWEAETIKPSSVSAEVRIGFWAKALDRIRGMFAGKTPGPVETQGTGTQRFEFSPEEKAFIIRMPKELRDLSISPSDFEVPKQFPFPISMKLPDNFLKFSQIKGRPGSEDYFFLESHPEAPPLFINRSLVQPGERHWIQAGDRIFLPRNFTLLFEKI